MKIGLESLVSLLPSGESIKQARSKSVSLNTGSFAEALSRVKEQVAENIPAVAPKGVDSKSIPSTTFAPTISPLSRLPLPSGQNTGVEEGLHERALSLRDYRQTLLASNIANADTPGYKAMDFDIEEALRNGRTTKTVDLKYVTPSQGSVDGNTVDMDVERVKFAANALMYEYHIDRVRGHYKDMEDLLKNTPY